jgi:putative hemolysin
MTTAPPPNPFAVSIPGPIGRLVEPLARWLLALPQLNDTYQHIATDRRNLSFAERAIANLGVTCDMPADELARIPGTGPLVVVSNHPFGGIDGLILSGLLRRVRPDVKVLVNRLLHVVPELGETSIFVDAFGGPDAVPANIAAMRAAVRWLRGGGALGVFPAGEVSHLDVRHRTVRDSSWHPLVARLATLTGAAVLPIFFGGRNSGVFQLAGLLHPRLRTALLPRELLKQRGRNVIARIGSVVAAKRLATFDTNRQRIEYLRARTYLLGGRETKAKCQRARRADAECPVAAPDPADKLQAEIDALPADQCLAQNGDLAVHFGRAGLFPAVVREIGRLREIAFRGVGEGTGRDRDLDRFDDHYLHLFVWSRSRRQVIGAYRLGLTDEILPRFGPDGLYTTTLFHLGDALLRGLTPAIELGRSFVRPECQREFAPLMLLWAGIGQFVARHPRYRRMFGPVSISNDYSSLTKQLLATFLTIHNGLPRLARLVTPRNPPRFGPGRRWETELACSVARSLDDVDALVAEIEQDRRGVPVLLRQYLRLGARLLGFNVDPDFGNVLDGLMLIDLLDVEPVVLNRYMGRENADAFRRFHARTAIQSESAAARGER